MGENRPYLPSDAALAELFGIAYQTSLLSEEGRKLSFRIIFLPKESLSHVDDHRESPRVAAFNDDREMSTAELRRLAPAADSVRAMICVDYDLARGWVIWALLDTGANWWQFSRHETGGGVPPPVHLTLASSAPGELSVSSAGNLLLALRSGDVYMPSGSALNEGPICAHFEASRGRLYSDVISRLDASCWSETDNNYPARFHAMCLSRILTAICDLSHGGTVLVVPDELLTGDGRLQDRVNIKHPCKYDYAWDLMIEYLVLRRRYYAARLQMLRPDAQSEHDAYHEMSDMVEGMNEKEEALADCLRFIASLSSVDGALVMTERFRVLGFGGEVIAASPTLRVVKRAENLDATRTTPIAIESYGTRHRSAFRFCSSYEEAMAFVVSADGGLRAVKRVGADVIFWPEIQPHGV